MLQYRHAKNKGSIKTQHNKKEFGVVHCAARGGVVFAADGQED